MKLLHPVVALSLLTLARVSDSFQSAIGLQDRTVKTAAAPFSIKAERLVSLSLKAASKDESTLETDELKANLIAKISEFRQLKERDGDVSIDFGVKGGELNATDRAPQTVDFYSISKDVGDKAAEIYQLCDTMSSCSPISNPTEFLGDRQQGYKAPLNGPWKSLFTNAADANFSKNSTRGDAKAQNIVNATKGTITNVIDFATLEDGTEPVLKQLNVVIKAIAASQKRVEIQFRYAKAVFTKFLWFRCRWALYIPVPGPFITRCINVATFVLTFGRKQTKIPKGYFDLLYLDDDLRIHRTGQGNLFVQAREKWSLAQPLL